jgi:LuxR family maltose regulon positive regulatory protein
LNLRAWLALWQGDIDAARDLRREVVQEAKWLGDPANVVVPNLVLAAVEHNLCGDAAAAQRILQGIADAAARNPHRRGQILYLSMLGGLATALQDWPAASQALQTIDATTDKPEWPFLALLVAALRAELALHRGDADEALSLLRPLLAGAMDADAWGVDTRIRVTVARAELRAGTAASAWPVLGQALHQAMETGQPLGLLLCGPAALAELAQARWGDAADAPALAYLRKCSSRARELLSPAAEAAAAAPPDTLLSDRELQVLTLVAQGQSNKLIARQLGLSPHTVKRHMARIFDKTGQSSRGQVAAWHRSHLA